MYAKTFLEFALFFSAPKANDEVKPQTANKPRKGSKDLATKPSSAESEAPKEPAIKEEPQTKPHLPPGAKQVGKYYLNLGDAIKGNEADVSNI